MGAGYRHFAGPDETAFVAEFSLPLPLFNQNEAGVREAIERLERGENERRVAEVSLTRQMNTAYAELQMAQLEARIYGDTLIPRAAEAFSRLQAHYGQGRFSYGDVLDAQRTLIATRTGHVKALADYHRAVALIETLVGDRPTAGLTSKPSGAGESK